MTGRQRNVVFGDDPQTYEAFRPDYPAEALSHLLSLTGITRALEVGAGTGKATADIARAGVEVVCIEPSPEMAAILDAKSLPGVSVEVSTFEDWEGEGREVDLIYAAQAWHWVERPAGYEKALRLLRPGGVLALLWNIPGDRYPGLRDVYQRLAPQILAESDGRIRDRDEPPWLEEMTGAGFVEVSANSWSWSRHLDASAYRSLNSTYSDHMLLDDETRGRLLNAVEDAVETSGGTISLEYTTNLYTGVAPS